MQATSNETGGVVVEPTPIQPTPRGETALITKFKIKRQQQKTAQIYLQSQYPKSKQIADVVVACVWTAFAIRLFSKIIYAQVMGSYADSVFLILYVACGALLADFLSGMIHWACDTYGTLNTPFVGKTLIRSFREHHVDPTAITRHPFAETVGNSFFVTLPWVATASLIDINSYWFSPLIIFWSVVMFWMAFTNQIHKWAHTYNPPTFVKYLQKSRIILQGKTHNYHHFSPYDRDYCITTGWLNPLFLRLDLWKKMEAIITKYVGTVPREDDSNWTFQDTVAKPETDK